MSTVAATPAAPAAAPAAAPTALPTESKSFSLRDYRQERATPAPAGDPAPDGVTPDPDVDADPELAKEIDALEKPADNETPQQKAARTRKHKETAIKSRITRLAKARDGEKTRADAAERELEEWRTGKRTHTPAAPAAATPAAGTTAAAPDTSDPKPTLKDFPLDKFKDEEDPYEARSAALAEAVGRWGARQEAREREHAAAESRRREQADQDTRERLTSYEGKLADAKTRIPDFDAVVQAATFPSTPVSLDVFDAVMRSEHAGDLAYALAKDPERTNRILRMDRTDALRAIGKVEAEVEAALGASKKAAEQPRKVTSAAEPVAPVTAAAATGAVQSTPVTKGTDLSLRAYRSFKKSTGQA